ncbi:helix-turn-helix domain-containing protein [Neobacillus sp. DY30]|uniref:helix-turn-helix domain-containing protein n=1 Tax=Neobacillus sp. DY30 TaxID=3047871 RepID=UPI0024C005E0|nr:helix-turn-helix domain-containing protein [Neobacillus sp. DY30]WHY01806.1 helix-turn-helix domain-containing protein [Neobacillus sp. DY30]
MNEKNYGVLDLRDKKFTQVTNVVLQDRVHLDKTADKLVYVMLCMHADNTTKKSYPSVKTLAKECSCSENTVRNALKKLKELRLIDIKERKSNESGQLSNLYVLLNPSAEYEAKVKVTSADESGGSN